MQDVEQQSRAKAGAGTGEHWGGKGLTGWQVHAGGGPTSVHR